MSQWTPPLEELRVGAGLTLRRRRIRPGAAVLRLAKRRAGALARHYHALHENPKLLRANHVQIRRATRRLTPRRVLAAWKNHHGEVVAVDEADVVEIESGTRPVERELHESGRRLQRGVSAFASAAGAVGLAP
ncbi:hypothetical protein TIFTF001_002249 [Ficus carica]|uniref:Uncharacterized protein n=1 Tax=Ficus carica TaxID=3494 RepID=A0AA88CTD9_FICCA|nr:hypothetical protein TIFTF001_002249 [Ficus carica]